MCLKYRCPAFCEIPQTNWMDDVTWKPNIYTYTVSRIYTQQTWLLSLEINTFWVIFCKELQEDHQSLLEMTFYATVLFWTPIWGFSYWCRKIFGTISGKPETYIAIHVTFGNSNAYCKTVGLWSQCTRMLCLNDRHYDQLYFIHVSMILLTRCECGHFRSQQKPYDHNKF